MPPNRDVVKSKLVPPEVEHGLVEHGLVEPQDPFFRDSGRRRHELAQPVSAATGLGRTLVVSLRPQAETSGST